MNHSKHTTNSPYSLSFASPSNEGDCLSSSLGGGVSQSKHKGFTLVELIVVVTILAILATIGFVSYSSYLTGVRDTNRLAQMVSISDGLELYRTQKDLPLPDASVEVSVNGSLIAYQGTAGSNTLETIDFTKGGVDPRDKTYFSYYLTKDRKHYQLLGFLEEEASITSHNNTVIPSPGRGGLGRGVAQAVSYDNRIPTVYGRKLGILTDDQNTPIEQTGVDVDITASTTGYIAHMTDTETLSGSTLQSINPKASCLRIKQLAGGSSDGVYEINPTGVENAEFDVYCDMTTDGGGWTFFMFYDATSLATDLFATPSGTYSSTRQDSGTEYSLSSDIFSHTEMMVILDDVDPLEANQNDKIVFFQYDQGHSGFNQGPVTCVGLTGYSYKQQIGGSYNGGGTNNSCTSDRWYGRNAANSEYLLAFGVSGVGSGARWTDDSYSHDAWLYVR